MLIVIIGFTGKYAENIYHFVKDVWFETCLLTLQTTLLILAVT